ncbi:hypothetical protein [Nocardia nova]|nr:hypothetical protein [Nocardia nova]
MGAGDDDRAVVGEAVAAQSAQFVRRRTGSQGDDEACGADRVGDA